LVLSFYRMLLHLWNGYLIFYQWRPRGIWDLNYQPFIYELDSGENERQKGTHSNTEKSDSRVTVAITIWLTVTKYHRKYFYRTWLYICLTWRMYYRKQELLSLREHLGSSQVFGWVRVVHLFSFLRCVFCLFAFVLCLVYLMLPVYLDYPFLIAASVFSIVYLCLSIHIHF